jgi:tRNA(Arg) A34 adenosine deaminase TadA
MDTASETNSFELMQQAIALALNNIREQGGGPFGAIVVKEGKIIGKGSNKVTTTNDPTAHAEVMAIRDACQNIGCFELKGCEIYASCEPCPMCLSAIYWSRIEKIYYCATADDAAQSGFDDKFIYEELKLPANNRSIPVFQITNVNGKSPFSEWDKSIEKTPY